MTLARTLALSAALFGASGCDLAAADFNHDPISATGTVTLADTGEPLAGLGVTIYSVAGSGFRSALVTTRTDGGGRFALSYDPPDPMGAATPRGQGYTVEINSEPYDARYFVDGRAADPGDEIDFGMVALERNAPLTPAP